MTLLDTKEAIKNLKVGNFHKKTLKIQKATILLLSTIDSIIQSRGTQ